MVGMTDEERGPIGEAHMSRRNRWSLAGFILCGGAFLSLVAQASFLAYSNGPAAWTVQAP